MKTLGYLVIPNYYAQHVNAEANQYVAGLPAITSFTGFAHQQIRLLNQPSNLGLLENGTAIVIHDLQLREGHPRCPAYMKDENGGEAASIVEEFKADMQVSLIIRVGIDKRVIDEDDEVADIAQDTILKHHFIGERYKDETRYYANPSLQNQINHSFLAGGHCVKTGKVGFLFSSQLSDWLQKEMAAGYFIQDRYDLLVDDKAHGISPLDSVLSSMTTFRTDANSQYQRSRKGWIMPVAIGYQAIETPQQRPQARGNYPHVYAEPVTGLAEAVSAKRIAHEEKDLTHHAVFWMHQYQAENSLYYVTAQTGQ
jgi:CRISPR type I-F-associated protein Csy2